MMVGRHIDQLFPKEDVPIGATVLEVRNLSLPRRRARTSASRCGPARSSASPGSSAPGGPRLRSTIFGITPATSGEILIDGKPVTIGSPDGARATSASPMCRRTADAGAGAAADRSARTSRSRSSTGSRGASWSTGARRRGSPSDAIERFGIRARGPEQRVASALRRQPAEGRARQMARDQAPHPDPGRADARHRCRRQGRDPPR